MPLRSLHPHAEWAARLAICAEQKGEYVRAHRVLFGVDDWEEVSYSSLVGSALGPQSDTSCIHSDYTSRTLAEHEEIAEFLGATGTPTLVFPDGIHVGVMSAHEIAERLGT